MKEQTVVIQNRSGMHARPAKLFVTAAKQFQSDIRMVKQGKKANAKSLVSLLTLGIRYGQEVTIVVEGDDEANALQELTALIASGLGEAVPAEHEAGTASKTKEMPSQAPPQPMASTSCEMAIKGAPAAPGIAIGPLFQHVQSKLVVEETFAGFSAEQARLRQAIEEAGEQLEVVRQQMIHTLPDEAAIFDVHLELLEDPELREAVLLKLEAGQSAAQAWQTAVEDRITVLKNVDDPLLAERVADLQDIRHRVLRLLMGASEHKLALPEFPVILVANDLSPSDTATLNKEKVLGICTAAGGPTAHSAIIARALGIPAVVGAGETVFEINNGTEAILNGDHGMLYVAPDRTALKQAELVLKRNQAQQELAAKRASQPAITKDGHPIEVAANIGGLNDAVAACLQGAEGVGLLRTEFLFLERADPPTEQEQFDVYRDIVKAMSGYPVIIRTLDIGGDKPLPYLDLPVEENPFLGERGIRLCLKHPDLLSRQLRAIIRASEFGPIRIMFPMISDLAEWKQASKMVTDLCKELKVPKMECGMMIEVPSAALMADVFAEEVDFFSIGTNDLTQYTLAADRMHPGLVNLSDGLHPAVLRLIKRTADAAHATGKWVGVCGELGGDPQAIPILIGLGVDELSIAVPGIAQVKETIRSLKQQEARQLAEQAVNCKSASDVRALSSKINVN